jgi:hypothetical protein
MANPNIVNVTSIFGKTSIQNVGTSAAVIVENTAGSNKVLKINSLTIANVDGVNSADATVDLFRSSVSYKIANTVAVPADSTLIVISKDTAIYLEEGDSIRCLASAAGDLQAVCSYEEIS